MAGADKSLLTLFPGDRAAQVSASQRYRDEPSVLLPGKVKPTSHESVDASRGEGTYRPCFEQLFWSNHRPVFPGEEISRDDAQHFESCNNSQAFPGQAEKITAGDLIQFRYLITLYQ